MSDLKTIQNSKLEKNAEQLWFGEKNVCLAIESAFNLVYFGKYGEWQALSICWFWQFSIVIVLKAIFFLQE